MLAGHLLPTPQKEFIIFVWAWAMQNLARSRLKWWIKSNFMFKKLWYFLTFKTYENNLLTSGGANYLTSYSQFNA